MELEIPPRTQTPDRWAQMKVKYSMKKIKPFFYSIPLMPNKKITILGAGNVTKSLLLVTSLISPDIQLRIITRSVRSAELLRLFLNDLPPLNVDIVISSEIPDLSGELVVLTIGMRTARFSRRNKKQQLYKINQRLIASILPQICSSTVIVVTNPSTEITKFLVEKGVHAYGVGVANDQLRFNNQFPNQNLEHFFVGAHNFHQLVLGARNTFRHISFSFSHDDYKNILSRQDKKILSFKNFPNSILDFNWHKLDKTNASFPPEYRWYARQRIHSKFHNTNVSCSLAILNTICILTQKRPIYGNFSLEMPLYLSEFSKHVVLGWPLENSSLQPMELIFGKNEYSKLESIIAKYSIASSETQKPISLYLPFGDTVVLYGKPILIHKFFQSRLAYLFQIKLGVNHDKNNILAEIRIEDNKGFLENYNLNAETYNWETIPQHRGKNPSEHTDIKIHKANDANRVAMLPSSDAIVLLKDSQQQATIYCSDEHSLFHELRRLIRDEIAVPCLTSRGARVLHAGLISIKGFTILVLGESGGGKTSSILSLLGEDANAQYGSAERTFIWESEGVLCAMGLPESITVFPGTLQSISEYQDIVDPDIRNSDMWNRSNKIRLQQDEILRRSNRAAISTIKVIDFILEVQFDQSVDYPVINVVDSQEEKRTIFWRNDLTEVDSVRLPWLNWFPRSSNRKVYDYILTQKTLQIHRIKWSTIDTLRHCIVDLVARRKFYQDQGSPNAI